MSLWEKIKIWLNGESVQPIEQRPKSLDEIMHLFIAQECMRTDEMVYANVFDEWVEVIYYDRVRWGKINYLLGRIDLLPGDEKP
jgi:hypothetical protein